MGVIRFGILAGVSTDMQASEDRASIPDQIETCRRVIKELGGVEAGLFIMDGYSRSGYDSLPDALNDIPPLKEAMLAAEQGRIDVLMLDNWDRLGDLGQLVYTRFKKYRKQIYSARQSGRLQDPATYNPALDESGAIDIHIQGILQTYRINKLRRGLELGINKAVEDGRYSYRFPMGYKKDNDKLVVDAPVANLLIRLKDDFLAGATTDELLVTADASGIKPPNGGTWQKSTITRIFKNPFYCGKVFKDRWKQVSKRRLDNGKKSVRMKLNENAKLYTGSHPPLWSYADHQRLKSELYERYKLMPRFNPRNFSGLLLCAVCGKRAMFKDGHYRCRPAPDHVHLEEHEANRQIAEALRKALQKVTRDDDPEQIDYSESAIAGLEKKIDKIHQGWELNIYEATEATQKIAAYRAEIASIRARQEDKELAKAARQNLIEFRDKIPIDKLGEMFENHPPEKNNRMMRDIVSEIRVESGEFIFVWRMA